MYLSFRWLTQGRWNISSALKTYHTVAEVKTLQRNILLIHLRKYPDHWVTEDFKSMCKARIEELGG